MFDRDFKWKDSESALFFSFFFFWLFFQESFQRFPTELSYMPEVMKRLSLARQIDKILHKDSQVIAH